MAKQQSSSFQFLQRLAEKKKVHKASFDITRDVAFLGVVIRQKKYHIPVSQIREIVPEPQLVEIGHTKLWLKGLLKVQGEIYSVIDGGVFLGIEADVKDKHRVAIALSMVEGNYAIMVSSVLGITKVGQLQHIDNDDYTVTYQTLDKELILALSIPSIIESPELSNMSIF